MTKKKTAEAAPRFWLQNGSKPWPVPDGLAHDFPEHVRDVIVPGQSVGAAENPDPDVFVEVWAQGTLPP